MLRFKTLAHTLRMRFSPPQPKIKLNSLLLLNFLAVKIGPLQCNSKTKSSSMPRKPWFTPH